MENSTYRAAAVFFLIQKKAGMPVKEIGRILPEYYRQDYHIFLEEWMGLSPRLKDMMIKEVVL